MRLGFLRHPYHRPRAGASVYLVTSRAGENAADEVALRWRAAEEKEETWAGNAKQSSSRR